jgi:hypothetical protein
MLFSVEHGLTEVFADFSIENVPELNHILLFSILNIYNGLFQEEKKLTKTDNLFHA